MPLGALLGAFFFDFSRFLEDFTKCRFWHFLGTCQFSCFFDFFANFGEKKIFLMMLLKKKKYFMMIDYDDDDDR